MANAEDEIPPYAFGGAGEKLRKRPFRPEIYEEAEIVSHEAGRDISCLSSHQCGNFATFGKSELEEMLKQMTFTRSEAQHFISLMHSRTMEEEDSPTPLLSLEASITSGSKKGLKHGDESHNLSEEEITSPTDLEKDYKGSTISRQDSDLIDINATSTCLPITSPQHHPTTMENLPDEILSNIFIRLLAKQLAQMRSLSKSWNALLSHSSFIKSHLHHSIHNKDQILLLFHYKGKYAYESKLFTAKPTQSPDLELADFIKLPPTESKYTRGIRIIGSVNGLICSSNKTKTVVKIWNPSLSAVLTLPPYSIPDDYFIKTFFRFGYDPKTDDYKVVKLTRPTKYANKWYPPVEIYSMRKGSWELITERFPSHITDMKECNCVCVDGHDGHLHWLGCTAEYRRMVVAFDLGSETFYEIPLPLSTSDEDTRLLRFNIGVLAGKLCVMSWSRDHAYAVWVMEEYGVAESWAKRHVFSQFMGSRTYPLGITSHNQFLIESNDVNIVVYDPSTNEQKVMENQHDNADRIVEYVDSLVWVPSLSLV